MFLIQNSLLTKTELVKRTWVERLFSWPWRPWQKWKAIQVPSDEMIGVGSTFFVHPAIYNNILKMTKEIANVETVEEGNIARLIISR
jgi:hypothetical protein